MNQRLSIHRFFTNSVRIKSTEFFFLLQKGIKVSLFGLESYATWQQLELLFGAEKKNDPDKDITRKKKTIWYQGTYVLGLSRLMKKKN